MSNDQSFPRILAQRPGGALLVALDAHTGCVYEPRHGTVYPRLSLASLLAQPYWERYRGDGVELRDWPGPPPTLPSTSSPARPARPVISLDADPHNADWLRQDAQQRKPQPKPHKGK